MELLDQFIKVGQCPEHWVDLGVIGNIVTEVHHRGAVEGAQLDGLNPQVSQVVQFFLNT